MRENINLTRGLVFSQRVLLALTQKGLSREDAYQLVQKNSLKAWDKKLNFIDLLKADSDITKKLTQKEIEDCFSLEPYLDKIDYIFDKVFSHES